MAKGSAEGWVGGGMVTGQGDTCISYVCEQRAAKRVKKTNFAGHYAEETLTGLACILYMCIFLSLTPVKTNYNTLLLYNNIIT